MRHVDQQAGVHVQLDPLAVERLGGRILQGAVLALPARQEADLVGVGVDDVGGRAQVHLARHGVDDGGIAGIDPLHDAARLPDGGDAQRLGDDGNVALRAAVLDDEPAQTPAVVVEQLSRAHGARHQNRVGRQRRGLVGAGDAAGQDAQQPVGQIVEVALALAPIGVVLAQHARAGRVLHALDRGLGGKPALDGLAQPALPALVVGEHAVGLEHVLVLAGTGQVLMAEHLVERGPERDDRRLQAHELLGRLLRHQRGDDDARLVQHDVAERHAFGDGLSLDHGGELTAQLHGSAGAGHGPRHQMLGNHHGGRLQHLDILVGVLLLRAVLHHEHAEHLAGALDRNRQQRMVDLLPRLGPVGEGGVARGLGLVDGDVELGAAPDQALAAVHAHGVHGGRVEALAGEQL